MTVIAAWVDDERKVWIGGDSAGVSNWELDIAARPKVFALGEMVIGYTSSFRMGQAIEFRLQIPRDLPDHLDDLDRYMAVDFSDAVRGVLRDVGYLKSENGRESSGVFIVGVRGCIYHADDDLHIRRTRHRFMAVGCGGAVASGALHAFTHGETPKDGRVVVATALKAAEALCIGCRGPFAIISTQPD